MKNIAILVLTLLIGAVTKDAHSSDYQEMVPYPTIGSHFVCAYDDIVFIVHSDTATAKFHWHYADKNGNDWVEVTEDTEGMVARRNVLEISSFAAEHFQFKCHIRDIFSENVTHKEKQPFSVVKTGEPEIQFINFYPVDSNQPVDTFCLADRFRMETQISYDTEHNPNNTHSRVEWQVLNPNDADLEVISLETEAFHLFTRDGEHQVRLRVWDQFGCQADKINTITIIERHELNIEGPRIVCQHQSVSFELDPGDSGVLHDNAEVEWRINGDHPVNWDYVKPGSVLVHGDFGEKLHLDFGLTADNEAAPQITVEVMVYDQDISCETAHAQKQVLFTAKDAPPVDEVIELRHKGSGLMIAIMENPEKYVFRWGVNDNEVDSEGIHYHDFQSHEEGRDYWMEFRWADHEACWNRMYYESEFE